MRSTNTERLEACKRLNPADLGLPPLDPLPEPEVTAELLAANAATYAAVTAPLRAEWLRVFGE